MIWTLFYLSGRRQQITGDSFKEALSKDLVKPEMVLTRVAFYVKGTGDNFQFDHEHNLWNQVEKIEPTTVSVSCNKCGVPFSYKEEQIIAKVGTQNYFVTCPGCGHSHDLIN
jgi:hypothetical protein